MNVKKQSRILAEMHETASGFEKAGLISKLTMSRFESLCIPTPELITADAIRAIRENAAVSQPVFAWYLNVSRNLVSDWERGVKKPGGPALRLLSIVKQKGLGAIV